MKQLLFSVVTGFWGVRPEPRGFHGPLNTVWLIPNVVPYWLHWSVAV